MHFSLARAGNQRGGNVVPNPSRGVSSNRSRGERGRGQLPAGRGRGQLSADREREQLPTTGRGDVQRGRAGRATKIPRATSVSASTPTRHSSRENRGVPSR